MTGRTYYLALLADGRLCRAIGSRDPVRVRIDVRRWNLNHHFWKNPRVIAIIKVTNK